MFISFEVLFLLVVTAHMGLIPSFVVAGIYLGIRRLLIEFGVC